MIKEKIKNNKGITLTALAVTVIILLFITGIIIYNLKDNLRIKNLQQLQNDIGNIRDKISDYYLKNGSIPAKGKYTNTSKINTISTAVDTGDFLVIDLSAIDNLTLYYGKDYEQVKELDNFKSNRELTNEEMNQYKDLYIINEASHNIFYVDGIKIDENTYYTDYTEEDVDKKAIDLRYIDGVQIPEGYFYVSGIKDTGITIKNSDDTEQYKWIVENNEITELPNDVEITTGENWKFIDSVNHYKGYYKNTNNNKVVFLKTDNWSPIYDKEGTYKDKNGDTANIPQGFCLSTTPGENTVSEGLVAKDSNNNEWVWIEVPKNIMPADLVFTNETGYSAEDEVNCATITADLKTYANPYTKGSAKQTYNCIDEWYADSGEDNEEGKDIIVTENTAQPNQKELKTGCGLTLNEYKETYQKMIKSVYKNGGFWIGRYEAGIEGTTGTDLINARAAYTSITDISPKAISQKDAIPYNFIYRREAQKLASKMTPDSNKTSSLLFGIQWDLVCKFLEVKSNELNVADINSDSEKWGNYSNVGLPITSQNAKGYSYNGQIWSKISEKLSHDNNNKDDTLLSTGASETTKKLNIYDFAGNEYEWTLEHATVRTDCPCRPRGGSYNDDSFSSPASTCAFNYTTDAYSTDSFRLALY